MLTPLRISAWPTAASIAVVCTEVNAWPTIAISVVVPVGIGGVSDATSTSSPCRSLRTTAGSFRFARSSATACSWTSSAVMSRPKRTETNSDTATATSPSPAAMTICHRMVATRGRARSAIFWDEAPACLSKVRLRVWSVCPQVAAAPGRGLPGRTSWVTWSSIEAYLA